MNNYYVYEWYNVDTKEVFYVGKGKGSRYKTTKGRNKYFTNYYNKHNCNVRKVFENMNEQEAFTKEIALIKKYRELSQCICNFSDGGQGSSGVKRSDEQKRGMKERGILNAYSGKTPFNLNEYEKNVIELLFFGDDIVIPLGHCDMPTEEDYDFLDEYDRMVDEMYNNDITLDLLEDLILSGFYTD